VLYTFEEDVDGVDDEGMGAGEADVEDEDETPSKVMISVNSGGEYIVNSTLAVIKIDRWLE
jgi:hypothetical protein